jgi:hypothetical protein
MLIVNDDHRRLAGVSSLGERCAYCSKTLAAYPLILSDDTNQAVYHVTCALPLRDGSPGRFGHLLQSACAISPVVCSHSTRNGISQNAAPRAGANGRSRTCSQRISAAMKAAIWDQAFLGNARVSCAMGPVVAVRRRKGQLVAMIRGWGRWYPMECVRIEHAGRQLLS